MIALAIGFALGVLWRRWYVDRMLRQDHRPRLLAAPKDTREAPCRCGTTMHWRTFMRTTWCNHCGATVRYKREV